MMPRAKGSLFAFGPDRSQRLQPRGLARGFDSLASRSACALAPLSVLAEFQFEPHSCVVVGASALTGAHHFPESLRRVLLGCCRRPMPRLELSVSPLLY